jgi:hypothetical protein
MRMRFILLRAILTLLTLAALGASVMLTTYRLPFKGTGSDAVRSRRHRGTTACRHDIVGTTRLAYGHQFGIAIVKNKELLF